MARYRLKNGHSLELGFGRAPITGEITQDRYDALMKENANFSNEFEVVDGSDNEEVKVKIKKDKDA